MDRRHASSNRFLPIALTALLSAGPALAAGDMKTQIEQMRRQIEQQQQLMQQQQQMMQKMQERLVELEKGGAQQVPAASGAGMVSAPVAPTVGAAALATASVVPLKPAQPKPPSALAGVGEPLPEGYVRLGDTGSLLKLDLVAQLDTTIDDTGMGSRDLFVPSSIPVRGAAGYDSGWRSSLSGRQSIFRMDFRRPSDFGVMKVVYKNNFMGSGDGDMPYNLQYLYGELENERYSLLAGYFLSAFTDIDAFPNTLDYEGPNSFNFKYTPQIRFVPVLYSAGEQRLSLPLSLEKPNADIGVALLNEQTGDDYDTFSRRPDITAGLRWETADAHLLWTNLVRDLRVESTSTGSARGTTAYATQLSGATQLFGRDSAQFWISYGKGYANFMQDITDLGLDAAFDPAGHLEAIEARGYGLGYTHGWTANLSSSIAYGYLRIDPDADLLIDTTLPESTQYASLNLAWQFTARAMLGGEYLWGKNQALDDSDGTGQRLQISLRYDLNP